MILVHFAPRSRIPKEGLSSTEADHDDSLPVISLWRPRQEDFYKFENCLGYAAKSHHKIRREEEGKL